MEIYFLGGSFDPPHLGHLEMVRISRRSCSRLIVFVANWSPGKSSGPFAPGFHRLKMAQLQFGSIEGVMIDDYELSSPTPSYTIDTIHYLRKQYPESSLTMIMGGDQLENFQQWRQWRDILHLVKIHCFHRPGWNVPAIPELKKKLSFYSDFNWQISSTRIREKLKAGDPQVSRFLHPDVFQYIRKEGLYL